MLRSLCRIAVALVCVAAGPPAARANLVVVLNSRDAAVQPLDQDTHKDLSAFAVGRQPHGVFFANSAARL
jgi:hypothetical protein